MARRVFTEVPYQYGDGKFGFALGQTRGGVEEFIMPAALWELDDASGLYMPPGLSASPRRPRVDATLTGSKVQQVVLSTTPLAAGGSFTGSWTDATDGRAVGFLVDADTPVRIRLTLAADISGTHDTTSNLHYDFVVHPNDTETAVFIPPIRLGAYYQVLASNPTAVGQTSFALYEIRQYGGLAHPQGVRQVLVYNLAVRDTSTHVVGTDPSYIYMANLAWAGDSTHPIFVKNGLDQQITVAIYYTAANGFDAVLGTFTVAAGATVVKTNTDFPGLDIPTLRLFLGISASVAPTTGTVGAFTVSMMGG